MGYIFFNGTSYINYTPALLRHVIQTCYYRGLFMCMYMCLHHITGIALFTINNQEMHGKARVFYQILVKKIEGLKGTKSNYIGQKNSH